MSDTPATDGGSAQPTEPDGPVGRRAGQRMPWQLMVAAAAWIGLGVTALVTALSGTGGSRTEADSGSVSQVQGQLGDSAASVGDSGGANGAVLVLIGMATLVLAGMLLLGQYWARLALTVIGAGSVVYFALSVGVLETLIAMVVLVVGSIMMLPPAVVQYLKG